MVGGAQRVKFFKNEKLQISFYTSATANLRFNGPSSRQDIFLDEKRMRSGRRSTKDAKRFNLLIKNVKTFSRIFSYTNGRKGPKVKKQTLTT